MICTLVPNSGRMRAPITVKGATLEAITLLMNWRRDEEVTTHPEDDSAVVAKC